jgi:DNA-directed RNA polymerase subunit RPC12/RpoP
MFAEGNSVPNHLKCDVCGHPLVELAREKHPRLPAHEIRLYACGTCGARESLSAPMPSRKDAP